MPFFTTDIFSFANMDACSHLTIFSIVQLHFLVYQGTKILEALLRCLLKDGQLSDLQSCRSMSSSQHKAPTMS